MIPRMRQLCSWQNAGAAVLSMADWKGRKGTQSGSGRANPTKSNQIKPVERDKRPKTGHFGDERCPRILGRHTASNQFDASSKEYITKLGVLLMFRTFCFVMAAACFLWRGVQGTAVAGSGDAAFNVLVD